VSAIDVTPLAAGTPITDGVRSVNFFNGRLLTAEDLRREQDATRTLGDRTGQAVGDGVVHGLRVRRPGGPDPARPVLEVSGGTALNREGYPLRLSYDVRISLAGASVSSGATSPASGGFDACSALPKTSPLTLPGIYLLTVSPAGEPVGRAPASGIGTGITGCGTDACAEGVVFRIVHLTLDAALLADRARLRNRLAQLMFGTDDPRRTRLQHDPFGTEGGRYGLLDDLRAGPLGDQEVPLACLLWTPGVGIEFVDEWSVRRRVATLGADSELPEFTGARRRAEGQARLLQFHAEVSDLARFPGAALLHGPAAFARLPAAGLLPLGDTAPFRGFSYRTFFDALPFRGPFVLDGSDVFGTFEESWDHEPIDLASGEVIWLYIVRQNQDEAAQPNGSQSSVLFTSARMRYRADARFDLGRWNAANYAVLG
jgi:hypothetical protein